MKQFFFFILIVALISRVEAQYFQTGEDPASIKWRQINTKNFQLIYPNYYEQQAQKLANVLEVVYDLGSYSLKYKPKKISVILHTQTVQSNGLVGYAPRRAEFYTTPHQSIYPQDWLEQLALHEFRHVVQIGKLNENLPKIIKAILGEQGTALVFGLHLPWWFIEGDAVVTETSLSHYGRGRLPSFLMEHQAQVVEKGVYSYDKSYFGSYRDFVPNHYRLGYYLVGGSRIKYGSDIWGKVLTRAGKRPVTFLPVNKVLKEETGKTKEELYYTVFDSLEQVWLNEDKNYNSKDFEVISPSFKNYTNYRYNHWLNDSAIISYKTSYNKIPVFVKIDKKRHESNIFRPGTIFNESVNYRDNLIVWSERIPDPRWSHSGKSLIRILNRSTKEIKEFHPQFKAFSPSISDDKSKVIVVEVDFSNNHYLSVYQIESGDLIERYQTANNSYFFSPDWISANEIATILLTPEGKKLACLDLKTKKFEILIDKDLGELKHLEIKNNYIYFISSFTGKNALYRIKLSDKTIVQIYDPRFGVESPAISDNKILLSDYTSDGFRLIEIEQDNLSGMPLSSLKKGAYEMADLLSAQEPAVPDFSVGDTIHYPSKKYNKTSHLINFHSWAPAFIDVDTYEISPGASILSQNKLGTAETVLGYKWDVTEKTGQFYAGYKYKGWYPVFNFEVSSGKRASEHLFQDGSFKRYVIKETNFAADIWIPVNLSKGSFNRYLQPIVSYDYTIRRDIESFPLISFSDTIQSLSYRIYYQQLLKKSYQDVYPDFGFILDITYRHSPFGLSNLGNLKTFQSMLFLPGIYKNHGIKLFGGYQEKEGNRFLDVIRYPRGWSKINTTKMKSFAVDYKFPLLYPDLNIKGLVYLQRMNVSLFADYAQLRGNIVDGKPIDGIFKKAITSFGGEVTFDMNVLRFYAPANLGFRASYRPEDNSTYFNLLYSINFSSL